MSDESSNTEHETELATAEPETVSSPGPGEKEAVKEEVANEDAEGRPRNDLSEGLAKGEGDEFKWFVAHALTGHENKVALALKENIFNKKASQYFSQILIPEESVVSNVNGKKRTIKKKFFPGYILLKMIMNKTTWHLVKNTDKITGFIGGTKTEPLPITDDEAAYILNQGDGGIKRNKSNLDFSEGDQVKVTEGPFATFVGTVENVSDKGKLKVNVSIFGRPTPVELDFNQVEKV